MQPPGTDTTGFPEPRVPVDSDAVEAARAAVLGRVMEEETAAGGSSASAQPRRVTRSMLYSALAQNEAGDANIYKALHRDRFVFNNATLQWLLFNGVHWDLDQKNGALAAVESVCFEYDRLADSLSGETNNGEDKGQAATIEALRRRSFKLRGIGRRRNVLQLVASSEDPLAIRGDEVDQMPWLLPCKNAVVDLRTGEGEPGKPSDYLLKASPTEWRGIEEPCPIWDSFINEIFKGFLPLVLFVQRLFGAALVGATLEHIFAVFTGRGRNGKGTMLETIARVLGDLAGPIRSELLLDSGFVRNSAGPSPDVMSLRGLRVAWASETDDGTKLSPGRVKWLTGNDTLRARNPNDKFEVSFQPTHNLFFMTNSLPNAPADDFAFWERVLVVPFSLSYVRRPPVEEFEREADPELPGRLLAEAPGILAWLVRGCLFWQRDGLNPPPIALEATAQYRSDVDPVGEFIEQCLITEPEAMTTAADLFDAFAVWWRRNISNKDPKPRWFNKIMKKRFESTKKGVLHFIGVRIRSDAALDLFGDSQKA